jgi:hypothetical protein
VANTTLATSSKWVRRKGAKVPVLCNKQLFTHKPCEVT